MSKGLYFEELSIGLTFNTRGYTVTEADIVNFAGVSGDYNPAHTDAVYASKSEFGQRVAHGALVFSLATGLSYQSGFGEGTIIAFRSMDWKFSLPVFIGDTVRCEIVVKETKPMPRLGGGLVVLAAKVINQDDKVVQRGDWTVIFRSKPEANGA